jgi:TonB family protein
MQARVGAAARAGRTPRVAFPGLSLPDRRAPASTWLGTAASALLHGGLIAALFLFALTPPPEPEVIPVQIVKEKPPPPPPKPKVEEVAKEEPAPAPKPLPKPKEQPAPAKKAMAERRSLDFAPQAQGVAPQVVNPTVVAQASPVVPATKLDMKAAGTVVAPKEIAATPTVTERVSAVTSVATATPSKVDLGNASAPALRGPVVAGAPVGPSVGPRQITTGNTVGTGTATNLPSGSSVREGIASDRDVLGTPDGPRLANVNTRVGDGMLRGDGGAGDGAGGGGGDGNCTDRPEVVAYLDQVKQRMYTRWILPDELPANRTVQLRFSLDVAGSVRNVALVSSGDPRLGESAVEALRAASPFPPMTDRVRCLSQSAVTGTFRNPGAGG